MRIFPILVLASILPSCSSSGSSSPAEDAGASDTGMTVVDGGSDGGIDAAADAAVDAGPVDPFTKVTGVAAGRNYFAYVPKAPAVAKLPVIFVLHGDGGTGASMHSAFPLEITTGNNAIVVFPSGANGGSWQLYTPPSAGGDYPYFDGMMDQMISDRGADATRIFMVGYSQGGFYANQLSCWRSARVRAIVSLSGGAPDAGGTVSTKWPNGSVKCDGQGPVSLMAIHGTSDSVVTPESGRWSATYWAAVNGCSDTRAPVSGFSPCEGHTGCPSGLYSYYCPTSGGHGISPLSAKLTWDFLKKF